ncbi:HNH endonuclease [Candidatus Dojkabacteria bacterium]|jgi:hypothetical protein|nr:HNH endonuclease [Candidatus Dojkabacteria bacterium]
MRQDYYDKATGYWMSWDAHRGYYRPKHEMVMIKKIHRPLRPKEIVHHRNEIKTDNRPSNLKLEHNYQQHAKDHGSRWEGKKNPSYNMTRQHKLSLKKAWKVRKIKFGSTGAKNPNKLRELGRRAGYKTPH